MAYLEKFSQVRVLVVGDVMLDRYYWGTVDRVSPEAPVPVVAHERTSFRAGGAANVAANVVGLGAKATLMGIVGDDEDGITVRRVLENAGIDDFHLLPIQDRRTTVKTRIIANTQQIVRLDQETITHITAEDEDRAIDIFQKLLEPVNVVVISDYAKGFLTDRLVRHIIGETNKKGKKTLIDPKGRDYTKYSSATILTPNEGEIAHACGLDDRDINRLETAAQMLMAEKSLQALVVTQGPKGMTILESNGSISHLSAAARNVFDVTGAGDTVVATLAVGVGCGFNFLEAAEIANQAAGLAVEKVGTVAVTREMLEAATHESAFGRET